MKMERTDLPSLARGSLSQVISMRHVTWWQLKNGHIRAHRIIDEFISD